MKISLQIPTTWSAISNKQLVKIAALFFQKNHVVLFDYKLLKILTNCKWYHFQLKRKLIILLKNVSFSQLKTYYSEFYNSEGLTRFVPTLKIKNKKFYAPKDRFSNLSIGELAVTEDLFSGYLNAVASNNSELAKEFLIYLTSVLYTTSSNSKRQDFVKEELDDKAALFKNVKEDILYATFLSYKGCKEYLSSLKKYKAIFPKAKETVLVPTVKQTHKSELGRLILSLSDKAFGDYTKTFNTNCYTFLDYYAEELTKI